MTRPSELSPEIGKLLSYLELLIVAKKMGIREFERRVKMSYGTLARLFSGKITLKFQTVLDMLEVLDVPPKAFFAAVFSADEGSPAKAEDLLRKVTKLTIPEPPAPEVFRAEIKRMIEEVLTERESPKAAPDDASEKVNSPEPSDPDTDSSPEQSRSVAPKPGRKPKPAT
jgi:transcriptional regulator with XRE-family HTH domain